VDSSPSGCSQLHSVDRGCTNDVSAYFWQAILCLQASRCVIDLTPLANPTSNGKPRYKYMSNPTHTLLRMYSKVLYVCVLQSLVQRSQTRDAYVCASFGSGFQTKCCTPLIPDCDSQEPITRELSTVEL